MKLGELINVDDEVCRDAIHVAVAPVIAGEKLMPGYHVGFKPEDGKVYITTSGIDAIGIVDPYLKGAVNRGEKFWLFLYPNSVTGMTHHWEHPAFSKTEEKSIFDVIREEKESDKISDSEQWLRDWCAVCGYITYEHLIELVKNNGHLDVTLPDEGWGPEKITYSLEEGYLTIYGRDAYGNIPEYLWDHVSNIIGRPVPPVLRADGFSCSC